MFQQATKFAPRTSDPFTVALESGFRAVEFWLGASLLEQWQEIEEYAKPFPFDYQLHFPNTTELDQEHLESLARLYRNLDCSAVVIHQPQYDQFAEEVLSIEPRIRLAVENHFLDSNRKLRKWADSHEYLTLDVEHLWLFTKKKSSLKSLLRLVESLLQDYGEKIIHVHLPGYLPGFKEHRPQYCSREMVMKVFTLLADHGYDGFVVSETSSRFQNLEELMMDRLLFQHWQNKRSAKPEEHRVLV